jgi:hypothetical protein
MAASATHDFGTASPASTASLMAGHGRLRNPRQVFRSSDVTGPFRRSIRTKSLLRLQKLSSPLKAREQPHPGEFTRPSKR